MPEINAIIEGLIFMSGEEGMSLIQIQSVLPHLSREQILKQIEGLKAGCQSDQRGIELVEYASRYKYVTKEIIYPYAQKIYAQLKTPTLSHAALETLAIIAYRGPITRVQIEEIRGVNCEMMLKKLLARELIQANGRLDTIGKPLLYQVSDVFMDTFELETLKELPEIETKEGQDELFAQIEEV